MGGVASVCVCCRFWRGLYGRYCLQGQVREREDEAMASLRQQNACLEEHIQYLTQVRSCDSQLRVM